MKKRKISKKFICIILILNLLTVFGPKIVFAEDTWQTAAQLKEGQSANFTIPEKNTAVWYKFKVSANDQTIQINIEKAEGGKFENKIRIDLYEGSVLFSGKTNNLTSWTSISAAKNDMYYKFSAAGDYYIKISGGVNLSELRIFCFLISPDPYENNERWQDAFFIKSAQQPVEFTITAQNDYDWYKINVQDPDQTLKINVEKTEGGRFENRIRIDLYEESVLFSGKTNSLFAWTSISTAKNDMHYKFSAAGNYYIKISGGVNLSPIKFQYDLISPDSYENNDTWQKAYPIEADKAVNFTITAQNDYDWYKINTKNAQTIQINLSKIEGGRFENNIRLDLYDSFTLMSGKTNTVASWNNIGSARVFEYELQNAGDYYIRLSGKINLSALSFLCSVGYSEESYIYKTDENIFWDYEKIPDISDISDISDINNTNDTDTVKKILNDVLSDVIFEFTDEQKTLPAVIDLVTLFSEEAISKMAGAKVPDGDIIINKNNIIELQEMSGALRESIIQTLINENIEIIRDMEKSVTFKTDLSKKVIIIIEPSATETKVENIRIENPDFIVSIPIKAVGNAVNEDDFIITVEKTEKTIQNRALYSAVGVYYAAAPQKKEIEYKITLSEDLKENIKYSFPAAEGDVNYQAVFRSNGEAVGGKYNPITKKIETRIRYSDTYTVKENKKNFGDIAEKSEVMREAINILASKGIINGTSVMAFSPDLPITRAEIAAMIVRTLSKLDVNSDGNFDDVKKNDWFFGAVGSAKSYGIIQGTSIKTFEPRAQIKKEQIIAIAARTLRSEMKWKTPVDTDKYLNKFTDKGDLPGWGINDFALASMADLIILRTDGKFDPAEYMTRGDAAIILYRLFMKIW